MEKNKVEQKIVGCNIPEFFEILSSAAVNSLGYFWCPIVVWRDENNKRKFFCTKKDEGKPELEGNWKKIITLTPHVYEG